MLKHTLRKLLVTPHLQYIVVIIFCTISLGLLVLPASLSQPIADDYFYFYNDDTKSIADTTINHYTTINGRWSQVLLVSIAYKLFGTQATQVIPVIEILLLVAVSTCLAFLILPIQTKRRALTALTIASLITTVSLYLLPSIFDSIFWLTSSTVYVSALISMISIAAAYLHLARRDHPNILLIILFILFIIASQAFNETASVITILLFSAILALLILKRISLGVNAIVVTLIGLLSSLAGLMIVFFAPGTAARRAHSTSSIDIQTLLTAPFGNFTYLIDILTSWRVLLIVTVGFAIWILMPRILKKRKFEIAIVGALLSAVPIYFNGLVAYYGVGGTPLRAYTIPTFLTVIGLSILIALMLQYIKPVKRTWFTHLRAMSLPVLIFCSLVITVSTAIPLIQAQVLRKSLVEYRTASIHKQINDNSAQISVAPAPNLLVSSEAVDLAYNENQTGWFVVYLQKYYKFDDKKMVIERHQPESYCLSDQAPSWFGAYICKDIANVR